MDDGEDGDDPSHGGNGPNHGHWERLAQDWSPDKVAKKPSKESVGGGKLAVTLPHAHHAHGSGKGDGKISGGHKEAGEAQPGKDQSF